MVNKKGKAQTNSLTCCARSRVYADAQFQNLVGTMTYSEARHLVQKVQCHAADLDDVQSSVRLRQSTHHYVRVSNCFHLQTATEQGVYRAFSLPKRAVTSVTHLRRLLTY